MRRKANDSSGCRVPHVTGVRYRRDSVSIRDYVIGGEYFPDPGNTFFILPEGLAIHGEYRVAPREYRPGHFGQYVKMPGIFDWQCAYRRKGWDLWKNEFTACIKKQSVLQIDLQLGCTKIWLVGKKVFCWKVIIKAKIGRAHV